MEFSEALGNAFETPQNALGIPWNTSETSCSDLKTSWTLLGAYGSP